MEHLETSTLGEAWWPEVEKFNKRRGGLFGEDDRTILAVFYRHGNSVVCELKRELPQASLGLGSLKLSVGLSHKSHRCDRCGNPGDKWDEKRGKTLALWSAMRDMEEEIRGPEYRRTGRA